MEWVIENFGGLEQNIKGVYKNKPFDPYLAAIKGLYWASKFANNKDRASRDDEIQKEAKSRFSEKELIDAFEFGVRHFNKHLIRLK